MAQYSNSANSQENLSVNFDWQKPFLLPVANILRQHIAELVKFRVSTFEEDTKEGTDLVLVLNDVRIAIRLRRDNIPYRDFTIRYSVPSGAKTELEKLRNGYADWYFYGWIINRVIVEYIIVNLHSLRQSGVLDYKYPVRRNTDNTTFIAIPISTLSEHGCLVTHQRVVNS